MSSPLGSGVGSAIGHKTADMRGDGIRALRLLSTHLMSPEVARTAHTWRRGVVPALLNHEPEDCAICSWLNLIEDALLAADIDTVSVDSASDAPFSGGDA